MYYIRYNFSRYIYFVYLSLYSSKHQPKNVRFVNLLSQVVSFFPRRVYWDIVAPNRLARLVFFFFYLYLYFFLHGILPNALDHPTTYTRLYNKVFGGMMIPFPKCFLCTLCLHFNPSWFSHFAIKYISNIVCCSVWHKATCWRQRCFFHYLKWTFPRICLVPFWKISIDHA